MEQEIYLSVIIPAYNEEKRLPKTLLDISSYLKKQSYVSEIIVVNGGSTDKTAKVAEDLKLQIENLKLIDLKVSPGKGYAVRQGILAAKGKYRVFTDADNSTPIDQVEKMWPEFEKGYDLVIGSRDAKGAVLDPPQPKFRVFVGDVFRLLRQIICGLWEILDTQCGFKGFKKEAAEKIFPKCIIDRFSFDPEVLLLAKKMGYKTKEIPIHWKNDLESKVKFKSMIDMLIDLVKIRWNFITGKYS